jgi:hypothetical protein
MKSAVSKSSLVFLVSLWAACAAIGADLEPPKAQIVDKLRVNVASAQVTQSMDTVSIGGAMGLSHNISVHANEFDFPHNVGFPDKYWAETRYLHISSLVGDPIPEVFRVSDGSGSADFVAYVNGSPVQYFQNTPQPYTYVPVGDERHSLVSINDELIWTKPDGTLVKYARVANAAAGAHGNMKEIVFPSGFTITIAWAGMQSVTTNTGFQLKYLYEADNLPMDKTDNPQLQNAYPLMTSAQSGWSSRNPRYVVAINNSLEYCQPSAATCALSNSWPTVAFEWPHGMPRSIYIGDSQARVIGPDGGVTKFDFRAYDLSIDEDAGIYPAGVPLHNPYQANTNFSPRLLGVTLARSTSRTFEYDFKTKFNYTRTEMGGWIVRAQTAGVIQSARFMDRTVGYSVFQGFQGSTYRNYGYGGGINHLLMSPQSAYGNPDTINYAETEDGVIRFESTARNFPYRFEKLSGPWEDYTYTRGNLSKVMAGAITKQEAGYPASCTPATQKICNQASWIKDARGNVTSYTYHQQSGQVASITYPANKNGFVAQTRFEYTQKSAQFYNGGGSKVSGAPIWMKAAERYCINSNYSGSACQGGDEVVTQYEYNHDNLLLTGMTVTSPSTVNTPGTTLRTCYQYDIYGNQIGVTEPNANLSSCN